MTRKTEIVKAGDWGKGRDKDKHFLITEWDSARAEEWGIKALMAYNRGGGQIPMNEVIGAGMEGIFILGVQTFLRGQMQAAEVIPILNELLECVQMVRDPRKRTEDGKIIATPIVSPDDIAEPQTRMWLRSEVLRVHTDFSPGDALLNLISLIMKKMASPTTETFPRSSDSLSLSPAQG